MNSAPNLHICVRFFLGEHLISTSMQFRSPNITSRSLCRTERPVLLVKGLLVKGLQVFVQSETLSLLCRSKCLPTCSIKSDIHTGDNLELKSVFLV